MSSNALAIPDPQIIQDPVLKQILIALKSNVEANARSIDELRTEVSEE